MFKSLFYYRYKSILILVSALTAITSIFLITSLSEGIVSMYSDMLKTDADIIITQKGVADTFFSDVDRGLIKKIEDVEDVKNVQAVIVGAGSISQIPIAGIYGVSKNKMLSYKLIKGEYLSKPNDVMLGNKIDIILKHPKSVQVFAENFKVKGVYRSDIGFENGGVVIGIEKASKMFKKSSSFLLVSLKNIENSEKVVNKIGHISNKIEVKTTNDFIKNYNQFKIIKTSGKVIASISFFMGFLAIVSIMSIMINDRRYEFGIKRAVGISKTRIILSVIIEVAVLTLVSFIIALLLSNFVLDFLKSIDKFQGYLSGEINFPLALQILLGSLIMSIIGALIPACIAAKTDPIVLIHQGA